MDKIGYRSGNVYAKEMCLFCGTFFQFDKGQGIKYRKKPVCDDCLKAIMMIPLMKHPTLIKYLKQLARME